MLYFWWFVTKLMMVLVDTLQQQMDNAKYNISSWLLCVCLNNWVRNIYCAYQLANNFAVFLWIIDYIWDSITNGLIKTNPSSFLFWWFYIVIIKFTIDRFIELENKTYRDIRRMTMNFLYWCYPTKKGIYLVIIYISNILMSIKL